MYADVFEFNGIKSSDLGYYIVGFDGFSNDGVGTAGNEVTFSTSKPSNSYSWNFHGSKYENPLTASFQIGKFDCGTKITNCRSRTALFYSGGWSARTAINSCGSFREDMRAAKIPFSAYRINYSGLGFRGQLSAPRLMLPVTPHLATAMCRFMRFPAATAVPLQSTMTVIQQVHCILMKRIF